MIRSLIAIHCSDMSLRYYKYEIDEIAQIHVFYHCEFIAT